MANIDNNVVHSGVYGSELSFSLFLLLRCFFLSSLGGGGVGGGGDDDECIFSASVVVFLLSTESLADELSSSVFVSLDASSFPTLLLLLSSFLLVVVVEVSFLSFSSFGKKSSNPFGILANKSKKLKNDVDDGDKDDSEKTGRYRDSSDDAVDDITVGFKYATICCCCCCLYFDMAGVAV